MRALVSDANGLVGKPLAQALVQKGWEVLGLVEAADADLETGFELRKWPKGPSAFGKSLNDIDVVFAVDLTEHADLDAVQTRLSGLIESADAAGVKRIVLLSSAEVYGDESLAMGSVSETMPAAASEGIGATALALENTLRQSDPSVDCRVLRPLTIFSPVDADLVARAQATVEQGKPFVHRDRVQGIDLADLVAAAVSAGTRNDIANHAFNLAGPIAVDTANAEAELCRVSAQLADQDSSEVRIRPEYPQALPLLNTAKAEALLHVKAEKPVWFNLSELAQVYIHQERDAGRLDPITAKMPQALFAVETKTRPLEGEVVVITGATSGIGWASTVVFARMGAHVVAIGRNEEAGARLMQTLAERSDCAPGTYIAADLSLISNVRAVAAQIAKQFPKIRVLINNAGAAFPTREETSEGFERTFAINVLAPLALTEALLEPLSAAQDARVINMSSDAHKQVQIDPADLQSKLSYDPFPVYSRAKYAVTMLSYCMAETYQSRGIGVFSMHPGAVRTGIGSRNQMDEAQMADLGPQAQQRVKAQRDRVRMQMMSAEEAAVNLAELAFSDTYADKTGLYLSKNEVAPSAPGTYDKETAWGLWEHCLELLREAEAA